MSAPLNPLFGLPRDSLDSRPHGRLSGQAPGADGVLAATHKLVQQAMTGQWQEVPKTVEERRVLLDRVAATAGAQDQHWLNALRQAMAESDRAVASMAANSAKAAARVETAEPDNAAAVVDGMMELLKSRP